jgi:hypothetical protein
MREEYEERLFPGGHRERREPENRRTLEDQVVILVPSPSGHPVQINIID